MQRQPPSSAADSNGPAEPAAAPLVAAGVMLARRGVYGLVWLDEDLDVVARYGPLVEFVEIGEPIIDSVPALIGLEADVLALRAGGGDAVDLPSVAIVGPDGATPRLNLTILWSREEQCFLLLVSRAVSRSDLEAELSRQIRARLIAEAEVSAKSRVLARTNEELARVNRDLEEFAAIISHDLKAPMRALRYLVDDLESLLGKTATGEPRAKLDQLREQARRMTGMLTSLLDYSCVGRRAEAVERVDTAALVAAVVRSIPRPPGLEVEVRGLWPILETLAAPLDLVVRNLVDNAIKHHDRAEGLIRIEAEEAGEAIEITVSDDGPGIAPALHDVVLLPFRTAGETGHGAGHGMGLALIKRTLDAVGGSLALHSDPLRTRGTAFRVTWPKKIDV